MPTKTFWITDNRFKFIAAILLIIFLVFMALLYFKADEITRDPCSICAEKTGENVFCSVGYQQRVYFPNNTMIEKEFGE